MANRMLLAELDTVAAGTVPGDFWCALPNSGVNMRAVRLTGQEA